MKLVHPEWEKQLEWKDGRFPLVVLENNGYHYRMVQALHDQISGDRGLFVLSEGERLLDMSRAAEFIPSPWSMDFANRKLMTAFFGKVRQIGEEEGLFGAGREADAAIQRYADQVGDALSVNLTWDIAADMVAIMKAIHLKPAEETDTLAGQMLAYMELCTELLGTSCFIFTGFRGFLEEEELRELYRTAWVKKLHFLLIEPTRGHIIDEEDVFTIDRDLCQIF